MQEDCGSAIGKELHDKRRRRRISMERAARETLIRSDYLKKIEAGDLTFLSPVYVRAFVKEYAAYLKLEPEPLLASLDEMHEIEDADEARILADEVRSSHAFTLATARQLLQGIAVVALFVWIMLLFTGLIGEQEPETATPAAAAEAAPESEGKTKETAAPKVKKERAPVVQGTKVRIVAAKARCWIEVVSDGEIAFSGILEVGEKQVFEAEDAMTLALGFPAGITMTVNGEDIGAPGGDDPLRLSLPDDLDKLRSGT